MHVSPDIIKAPISHIEVRRPGATGLRRSRDEIDAIITSILKQSPRPLGVYQIQAQTHAYGKLLAPMQIYRTLDRMIADGHVLRIKTLSAYVLGDPDIDAVAICDDCGKTVMLRIDTIANDVVRAFANAGLRTQKPVIEASGMCDACSSRLTGT